MTTIVNTPSADTGSGTSGALIAVILFALLAFLFFYFGLPLLNRTRTTIAVPDQIDVNVNTPNGTSQ